MTNGFFSRTTMEAPCTIEIEQTAESLHAHVTLDGDIEIRPGDEVLVHDAPTEAEVPFGERAVFRRTATVVRASTLERFWTKLTGNLEFYELYDVSFTERMRL
jgi:hypothetical protein